MKSDKQHRRHLPFPLRYSYSTAEGRHWGRIKTQEKANVVAVIWGTYLNHPGGKNLGAARNWINPVPLISSDDLCLLCWLIPNSQHLQLIPGQVADDEDADKDHEGPGLWHVPLALPGALVGEANAAHNEEVEEGQGQEGNQASQQHPW